MIDRLRKKFIRITMGSVIAVLALLMGVVNLSNYLKTDASALARLELLAELEGRFPSAEAGGPPPAEPDGVVMEDYAMRRGFSRETPYEMRYFSVALDPDGELLGANTGMIAAVSEEEAVSMARALFGNGRPSGYSGSYKYLTRDAEDGGTRYFFLDCTRDLESVRSFLVSSLLFSALGIAAVLVLVLALSRRAIRPVAESYEKQKQFITNAGHEIKTPLTIIDSCTEVIELEQGGSKWTEGIRSQVKRLTALTHSLVSLTRMDEAGAELPMEDFSLSEAVEDTLRPFELLAENAGLTLKTDIQQGLVLRGNEAALRQLCSILADNAVKYALPDSTVSFTLKRRGRRCALSCGNEAEGLARGNMDMLFDRFYRGDASRSADGGYGIGLSMARAIVAAHGGRISAESPDGRTLTVTALV